MQKFISSVSNWLALHSTSEIKHPQHEEQNKAAQEKEMIIVLRVSGCLKNVSSF